MMYVPDVNMRLSFYKRIASAENGEALKELKVELIDRFGLLPEATEKSIPDYPNSPLSENIGLKEN